MDYDVDGEWHAIVKTLDGNDLQITFDSKVDGDKATDTVESPAGRLAVDDRTYADGVVRFKVTVGGNNYSHELTAIADISVLRGFALGWQKPRPTSRAW